MIDSTGLILAPRTPVEIATAIRRVDTQTRGLRKVIKKARIEAKRRNSIGYEVNESVKKWGRR